MKSESYYSGLSFGTQINEVKTMLQPRSEEKYEINAVYNSLGLIKQVYCKQVMYSLTLFSVDNLIIQSGI